MARIVARLVGVIFCEVLPHSTFAPLRTTSAHLPVPSGERLDYGYALSVLRP
jgi:hypothetical protein